MTKQEVYPLVDDYVCSSCKVKFSDAVQTATNDFNNNPERYINRTLDDVIDTECYDTLPDFFDELSLDERLGYLLNTSCGCELRLQEEPDGFQD